MITALGAGFGGSEEESGEKSSGDFNIENFVIIKLS